MVPTALPFFVPNLIIMLRKGALCGILSLTDVV